MLSVRNPNVTRLGDLEVVADGEATDGSSFYSLDRDAEVVERHRLVGHGGGAPRRGPKGPPGPRAPPWAPLRSNSSTPSPPAPAPGCPGGNRKTPAPPTG